MKKFLGLICMLAVTACAHPAERRIMVVHAEPGAFERMELVEDGGAEREREHAHWQLEVLRMAMHALLEAERPDSADLVEHAIHARELALEGRDDDEAVRVRETAPGREQLIELMALARELLADRGREDQAEVVGQYERELRTRRVQRPRRERPDPRLAEHVERFMVRVEHLEANLQELMHHVERNQRRQAEHMEMSQREMMERIERLENHIRELHEQAREK